MLKEILNLKSIQTLSKKEQVAINGGRSLCPTEGNRCPNNAASYPIHCLSADRLCCQSNVWTQC